MSRRHVLPHVFLLFGEGGLDLEGLVDLCLPLHLHVDAPFMDAFALHLEEVVKADSHDAVHEFLGLLAGFELAFRRQEDLDVRPFSTENNLEIIQKNKKKN